MICSKCGASIEDDAKFCNICGARVAESDDDEISNSSQDSIQKESVLTKLKGLNNINLQSIKFLVGAVAFVVVLLLFATRPKTIDLNKYVVIETSGYDTVGTATSGEDLAQFGE